MGPKKNMPFLCVIISGEHINWSLILTNEDSTKKRSLWEYFVPICLCSNHESCFPLQGTRVCTHWKNVNTGWRVLSHDQATLRWRRKKKTSCCTGIGGTLQYQSCFWRAFSCFYLLPLPVWFILSFPDGLAAFRTFLKTEFSDENIEFWMACEEYKKIKSSTKLVSKANKIFHEFIDIQAPREVCDRC